MSVSHVLKGWRDRFRGNPDVAVTAIDTSGGIAMSRTNGQCPAFVQVSASAIDGTADLSNRLELRPYEDFHYEWDFGDPDGQEIFTDPRPHAGGRGFNLNNAQTAPEAVYCYRNPGKYTITLTVRSPCSGIILRRSVFAEFTATAFEAVNGTYYFDSVSGDDRNDGLTAETPKLSGAALRFLASTTDRTFYIKRGSSYDEQIVVNSRQRWASYGTGEKPTFSVPAGKNFALGRQANAENIEDVVVSGFDFQGGKVDTSGLLLRFFSVTGLLKDLYIDGCDATNADGPNAISIHGPFHNANASINCGIYNCTISTNLTPWNGQNGGGYAFGSSRWTFIVASYFEGGGGALDGTSIRTHHVYTQCKEHGCYLLNSAGFGTGKRSFFNLNWDGVSRSVLETARWHAISYCDMSGTAYGFDFGAGAYLTEYVDAVAQDNTIHDMTIGAWIFASGRKVTIRDQNVWGIASPNTGAGPAATLSLRLYRLKWYNESTRSDGAQIALLGNSWTQPTQFVDNIIMDTRRNANLFALNVKLHLSNGSLVDRNQWYAPNDATAILSPVGHNSATATFAQWQSLGCDPNGFYGNPGWSDAANGGFS
jgi:hypothetical protein